MYVKAKMSHSSMANMYKEIPAAHVHSHKLGSVYHLQAGLPTTNTISRYTLMPKSGDDKMIRGYSINMMHHIDTHTRIRVMDLIVETIKRIDANQKRSCGYAPYIHMLINSKLEKNVYALDRLHMPLPPDFGDNVMVMDPSHPTSSTA